MPNLPQVGRTENSLRALLERNVGDSRIPNYHAYVALILADTPEFASPLSIRLHDATHCGPDRATDVLFQLGSLGLLDEGGALTRAGVSERALVSSRARATAERLVDGIALDRIETAIDVLSVVGSHARTLLPEST